MFKSIFKVLALVVMQILHAALVAVLPGLILFWMGHPIPFHHLMIACYIGDILSSLLHEWGTQVKAQQKRKQMVAKMVADAIKTVQEREAVARTTQPATYKSYEDYKHRNPPMNSIK